MFLPRNPRAYASSIALLEDVLHVEELAADVDVGDLRADRVAADRAPLDEQMRIALHQQVILERARLALVGVAGDVARLVDFLSTNCHFMPVGNPAPPRPRRPDGLHHLDDLVRLLRQRLLQRLVAVVLEVEVEREGSSARERIW